MHNRKYQEALRSIPFRSVSFGSMAVRLYDSEQFAEAQIGYSIHPDGTSLISDDPGSCKENWLIVGYEDLGSDPVFIDTSAEESGVYTAMHGTGSWDTRLVASDVRGFAKALETIATLSRGRENPVEIDANPLSVDERDRALGEIKRNNPEADISFWEDWLNQWE
jgi:hypothetical protein